MERRRFLMTLFASVGAAAVAPRAHAFTLIDAMKLPPDSSRLKAETAEATPADMEKVQVESVRHQRRRRCHYYRRHGTVRRHCHD